MPKLLLALLMLFCCFAFAIPFMSLAANQVTVGRCLTVKGLNLFQMIQAITD